jgi:hypothetical protein
MLANRIAIGTIPMAFLFLSACSSIVSGTSETIGVVTNPPGAVCHFNRNGQDIATINPTPGGAVVQKTKYDIDVICNKDGYQEARAHLKSEVEGATFGNIVLGGGIGWAIDSASGADNHYQESVNISLVPLESPVAGSGQPATPASGSVVPANMPVVPKSGSVEERLKSLQALRDKGIITPEEYEKKRNEILSLI